MRIWDREVRSTKASLTIVLFALTMTVGVFFLPVHSSFASAPSVPTQTDDGLDPVNLIFTGYAPSWWLAQNLVGWDNTAYCSTPKTIGGATPNADLEHVDSVGFPCLGPRDHVRIWDMGYSPVFGTWSIGAVHHDKLVCNPLCHHVVDSWENAERDIGQAFASVSVAESVVNYTLGNAGYYQNVYNDGNATLVVLRPPQTTYSVMFNETGLAGGTLWSVTLDGSTILSKSSSIGFTEPNGTYPYSITPVQGYNPSPSEGVVSVNGSAVTELLSFAPSSSPDFTIGSTPRTMSAILGETAMSTINVTVMNGLSGNVTLSESTMPSSSSISCSLSPVEVLVTSSSSSRLSCTAYGVGSYNVTVTAGYNTDSRSVTHTTTVSITFALPEADFTITTLSPAPVDAGKHAVSTITITPVNGFTGPVRLSVEAPSNVSCEATSPDIIETSGNATLSCSSILPGTYEVIITATSGSRIHTQTLSIAVNEEETPDGNTSSSLILGLPPTMIYGILGGAIVAILVAGLAMANRASKNHPMGNSPHKIAT